MPNCVRRTCRRPAAFGRICAFHAPYAAGNECVRPGCRASVGEEGAALGVGIYCADHVPAPAAQVAAVTALVAAEGAAIDAETGRREQERAKRRERAQVEREQAQTERAAATRRQAADFARAVHAAAGYVTKAKAAAGISPAAVALARRERWVIVDNGKPFRAGPIQPPLRRGERRGPRQSPKLAAARTSILAALSEGPRTTADLRAERPECERTFARAVSSLIEEGELHESRQGGGVVVALPGHALPPTAAEALAARIVVAASTPSTSPELAARLGEDHRESTFRRALALAVAAGRLSRSGRGAHVRYQAA